VMYATPCAAPRRGRRRPGVTIALALLAVAAVVTACSPPTPAPLPADLNMPKRLATVAVSPTPVSTPILPATSTPAGPPTVTPVPPQPTATRTPFVGIFMGDGSAPLVLPSATLAPLIEITLQPPTNVPGVVDPAFPTATAPVGPVAGGAPCTLAPDPVFLSAYQGNPAIGAALGCPVGNGEPAGMAAQNFQQGTMIWRSAGNIYALSAEPVDGTSTRYWRVPDLWQEGDPESDPSLTAPPDVQQPIRGFGLAWRSNAMIRGAIGWATSGESGYSGTYQAFERGAMLTGPAGDVFALVPDGSASPGEGTPGLTQGRYYGPLF